MHTCAKVANQHKYTHHQWPELVPELNCKATRAWEPPNMHCLEVLQVLCSSKGSATLHTISAIQRFCSALNVVSLARSDWCPQLSTSHSRNLMHSLSQQIKRKQVTANKPLFGGCLDSMLPSCSLANAYKLEWYEENPCCAILMRKEFSERLNSNGWCSFIWANQNLKTHFVP